MKCFFILQDVRIVVKSVYFYFKKSPAGREVRKVLILRCFIHAFDDGADEWQVIYVNIFTVCLLDI